MKIYRIAQEIEDTEDTEKGWKSHHTSYLDIGHSTIDDFRETFLWIYANGKFEVFKRHPFDPTTHPIKWKSQTYQNGFRGRFDPKTKEVSVLREGINSMRPIPDELLRKLKEHFPTMRKIWLFGNNSNMKIYRIAHEIIEREPNDNSFKPNYLEIGHETFPTVLWVFKDGKIATEKAEDKDAYHSLSLRTDSQGNDTRAFLGRYEIPTKRLSVYRTGIHKFRPVPEFLVRILKEKFPDVQKIYVF